MSIENTEPTVAIEPQVTDTVEVSEGTEVNPTEDQGLEPVKQEEDTPFPKKAINALSRRDKQIGKLRAEQQYLRQQLEALQSKAPSQPTKQDGTPDENQFETYGEYLKAVARYEARQELDQGKQQADKAAADSKEQTWMMERAENIDNLVEEASAKIPDFQSVIGEYAEDIADLPPHIKRAFLEAERPEMAFYALAKEGKLEAISNMSAYQAAIAIGKAEDRGLAMAQSKPVTKAPQPIAAAKGTGTATKSLETMTPKELMNWAKS